MGLNIGGLRKRKSKCKGGCVGTHRGHVRNDVVRENVGVAPIEDKIRELK